MKKTICTISTKSHLYKVKALFDSIQEYDDCDLAVLVIDDEENLDYENSLSFHLNDFKTDLAKDIILKYKTEHDKLRWSLKSIFISHLLQKENYEKVIYVDNDIFFYNKFDFLWEELDNNQVLLTPHYYPYDPSKNQNWFEANFRVGLYNAGFFAANQNALSALDWWANACLYRMEKSYMRGLFDDQKYLDLMPNIFPKTKVLAHQGCNVAEWNAEVLKRSIKNKEVLINDSFPIIFYHFNNFSFQKLIEDEKHILKAYFQNYFLTLKKYKDDLTISALYRKESKINKIKLSIWNLLNNLNK